jgi:hypothetical protein
LPQTEPAEQTSDLTVTVEYVIENITFTVKTYNDGDEFEEFMGTEISEFMYAHDMSDKFIKRWNGKPESGFVYKADYPSGYLIVNAVLETAILPTQLVSEPQAKTWVYDGEAHELVIDGSVLNDSDIWYAKRWDEDLITDIPTATDAGNYTVHWITGHVGNYCKETRRHEISCTVEKATAVISKYPESSYNYVYDKTEHYGIERMDSSCDEHCYVSRTGYTYTPYNEKYTGSGYFIKPAGVYQIQYEIRSNNNNYKSPDTSIHTIDVTVAKRTCTKKAD